MLTMITNKELYFLLVQLSAFWIFSQASLQITQFSMTTSLQPAETETRDLMNKKNEIVFIAPDENNMTLTCVAIGNPEPETTILHNNVPIKPSSRGEACHVVQNITCQDSGVYTCLAKNRFNSTKIERTIHVKRSDNIESIIVQPWKSVVEKTEEKMVCTAVKCSEPLIMAIINDKGAVIKTVLRDKSLFNEIGNIKCSDIGNYFCRMVSEYRRFKEHLDFQIFRCTNLSSLHNNSDSSPQESTNFIYIILLIIIVFLIVILIALVSFVLVHQYRGSVKEDNSNDSHFTLEEVISPCSHHEEVGKVDAGLLKESGEQTKTASSDARCEEVQYEVPVTHTSSIDTEHNYEEL